MDTQCLLATLLTKDREMRDNVWDSGPENGFELQLKSLASHWLYDIKLNFELYLPGPDQPSQMHVTKTLDGVKEEAVESGTGPRFHKMVTLCVPELQPHATVDWVVRFQQVSTSIGEIEALYSSDDSIEFKTSTKGKLAYSIEVLVNVIVVEYTV